MFLPKYLRPIYDVESHKLTATEKAVRFVVFTPFLILFSAPKVLATVFMMVLGIWGIALVANGFDTLISNPGAYRWEITIAILIVVTLIVSTKTASAIRKYFLPFG